MISGLYNYCLGLINYYLKGDQERAREDFKRFLDSTSEKQFPEQRVKAREYLDECEEKPLAKAAANQWGISLMSGHLL